MVNDEPGQRCLAVCPSTCLSVSPSVCDVGGGDNCSSANGCCGGCCCMLMDTPVPFIMMSCHVATSPAAIMLAVTETYISA